MRNKIIAIKQKNNGYTEWLAKKANGLLSWLHLNTQLPLFLSISSKEMALMLLEMVPPSRVVIIFESLSDKLKEDKGIVMFSISRAKNNDVYSIILQSKSLLEDKDVFLLALHKADTNDISYLLPKSKTLKNNKEIVLIALRRSNNLGRQRIYTSLHPTLQLDTEITSFYIKSILRKNKGDQSNL